MVFSGDNPYADGCSVETIHASSNGPAKCAILLFRRSGIETAKDFREFVRR
ncbi:MAG TPA: hypothetical protein VNA17_08460 [Pyrinomonadaceae bacterium]|nr:hypothetical protein [Pyrinomonadaceae bacterium]